MAARKREEEAAAENASKAVAKAEEAAIVAAPLQGAIKKKAPVNRNIMLKGARMAFSSGVQTGQTGKIPFNKVTMIPL